MAKCTWKMPDDFTAKLSTLGNKSDQIMEEVLQAGGEVVLEAVKSNLNEVIGSNTKYDSRSTGELESSLGLSRVLVDRDGNSNIKVGFAEPRSDGDSNAKIANIIEYGSSTMTAKPFLAPAKSKSRNSCKKKMIEILEQEVNKL